MELLVGMLSCLLVGAPAVKLLLLARSTGKRQLWALAVCFSALSVTVPLRLGFGDAIALQPSTAEAVTVASFFTGAVTVAALYVFNWLTFRPRAIWAKRLAIAGVGLAAGLFVAVLSTSLMGQGASAARAITPISNLVPILWVLVESVASYRRMRRQVRLGIGDPVVANRFLLWAVWSGCFTLAPLLAVGLQFANARVAEAGTPAAEMAVRLLLLTVLATLVVFAISLWLSFFPTSAYLRFLRRREGAVE